MPDTANGTAFRQQLAHDTAAAGGAAAPHSDEVGAVGKTLFDLPGSTDLTVTVVIPEENLTPPRRSRWCGSSAGGTAGSTSGS